MSEGTLGAGVLSDAGRREASAAVLPLLASYFADASTYELHERRQVAGADAELGPLGRAVRFRVALAAARRFESVFATIAERSSFRYVRRAEESVGAVRGGLDVPRYVRARARREAPRRYPVRVVRRDPRTPENVLLMYTAGWLAHELAALPRDAIPAQGPERREIADRHASIGASLRHPILGGAVTAAIEVWRRRGLTRLRDEVDRRLTSGHIAAREAYTDLLTLVDDLAEPGGTHGEARLDWLAYDARFDTTLYELWTLGGTARALARRLGEASFGPRPLWDRGQGAIWSWDLGSAKIRLHFQPSPATLGLEAAWRYDLENKALGARPDVAVSVEGAAGGRAVVLVEAKLRRREARPAEEIYKVLGYMENLRPAVGRFGSLIFYTPGENPDWSLSLDSSVGPGHLLTLGLDPEHPTDADVGFDRVATLAARAIQLVEPHALEGLDALRDTVGEEARARARQERAVASIVNNADRLPRDTLEPFHKMLAAQLPGAWPRLEPDVQRILGSAVFFGSHATPEVDHSGPLLGLCAACERVLTTRIFDPLGSTHPDPFAEVTLGGAAFYLRKAKNPVEVEHQLVRTWLDDAPGVDSEALQSLGKPLERLRVLRNAAAHTDVVDEAGWNKGYEVVLSGPKAILPRLMAALP